MGRRSFRTGRPAVLAHELAGEATDGQDSDARGIGGGLEAHGDAGICVLARRMQADAVEVEVPPQPHVLDRRLSQRDLPRRPPRWVLLDQEVRL